ncbi:MAG: GDSL-type esterase/lipase family protein [Lysobacterales bacterium]
MLKLVKDGWIIIGLTLALLLLTDAALKTLIPNTPGALVQPGAVSPDRIQSPALADAPWVEDYFKELRQARRTAWSPWEYWRRQPYSGEHINIDANGVRRSWQPPEPRFTVWMLGGSTVWGTGARDDHTLPSALARELAGRNLPTSVINLGESGFVSAQSQIRFLRRLETGQLPDLVIFYDGVNDVFAALQSGLPGVSQNESHRKSDFRVTDGVDNYLQAAPRVLEGVGRLLARSDTPEPVQPLAGDIARTYAARVHASFAVADAASIPALFYWQPSVFSKTPLHTSEQAVLAASLARHQALQQATDKAVLAALAGTEYWSDLSQALDGDGQPLLMDFCHLSEAGNRRVAEQMAGQVAAALVDPGHRPSD